MRQLLFSIPLVFLALLSSGIPSFSAEGARGGRTTIVVDDGRTFYYRRAGRCTEYGKIPYYRWSIRLGAGISSVNNAVNFVGFRDYAPVGLGLSDYYGDWHGQTVSSGAYSIGAEYLFARWFSLSFDASVEYFRRNVYDGTSGKIAGKESGTAVTFMPQAKFVYLNRPAVRLYGYIGVGFVKYFGFEVPEALNTNKYVATTYGGGDSLCAAVQVVPIGVEAGHRFFGFAEVGGGYMFTGLRAGFGYRF